MCHLGTHTHATVQTSTPAAAATAHIWHPGSLHADWLVASRDHLWQRDADDDLRTFAASLAVVAHDC